jgi:CshA-type fibril repeat protein
VTGCSVANGVVTIATVGTFEIDSAHPGSAIFRPLSSFVGDSPSVTYTVTDSMGGIGTNTYTPHVIAPPVVNPDTTTGAWNTAQSIDVVTNTAGTSDTVDSATSWKPSSITISCAAALNCSTTTGAGGVVTSVIMDGQGTYTVDVATEVVTFTPLASFTGTARPVTYVVSDMIGNTATTTYTPTVLEPADPTTDPETSVGPKGAAQTVELLVGDATANQAITFVASSVVLSCTVSTNCTVANGKVTIANVGEYKLDPADNTKAIFTPLASFVGTAPSVTYTVTDSMNNTGTNTYTPKVIAPPVVVPDITSGAWNTAQSIDVVTNTASTSDTVNADTSWKPNSITISCGTAPSCTTTTGAGNVVTSVTMTGQGTYTVDVASEVVTFTPVATFAGTARPVTYVVSDMIGNTATTTYTPTVLEPADPTADPETSKGPKGAAQTVELLPGDATADQLITFVASSVVLSCTVLTDCAIANGVVTIANVGEYKLDPADNTKAIFTPVANFVGTAPSVTYTVTDSMGNTASSTYTPTVVAPPVVVPDTTTGAWNTAQSIDVVTNTASTSDTVNPLTTFKPSSITISCGTATGCTEVQTSGVVTSVVMSGQGTYTVDIVSEVVTFTPLTSFADVARPVTYTVTDMLGNTASTTYTPTVTDPAPPTTDPETTTGPKGVAQGVDLLDGDTTSNVAITLVPSSVVLSCTSGVTGCLVANGVVTIATVGTFEIDSAHPGSVIFRPLSTFVGQGPSITYTVTDSLGNSASNTYTPKVIAPPVVTPDITTGDWNTAQSIDVVTNNAGSSDTVDSSTSWKPSSITISCGTQSSCTTTTGAGDAVTSVTMTGQGTYTVDVMTEIVTFTPVATFAGTARPVTYVVTDMIGNTATTTYTPTVLEPADPTADPETSKGPKGAAQTVELLPGDTTADPLITFVPASVVLSCTLQADCSVANSKVTIANVGEYKLDPADNTKAIFTPVANFVGTAPSVTYTVTDSMGNTATSTYTPTVVAPPVVVPDITTGDWNTAQSIDVVTNTASTSDTVNPDTSWKPNSITISCGTAPSCTTTTGAGDAVTSVTMTGQGTYTVDVMTEIVTFTPVATFAGTARPLTYVVTDMIGNTATTTYTPTVQAPPAPTADPETTIGPKNVPQGVDLLVGDTTANQLITLVPASVVLSCTSGVSGCSESAGVITIPNEGSFELDPAHPGTVIFTPLSTFVGQGHSITYTVTDSMGGTATNTYTPKVVPPPVVVPDTTTGPWNTAQSIDVVTNSAGTSDTVNADTTFKPNSITFSCGIAANCTTATGAGGVVTSVTMAGQGTYTVNVATEVVTFTPVSTYSGTARPVTYTVTDMMGNTATTTYTPTVNEPDVPAATPDKSVASQGQVQRTNVLAGDAASSSSAPLNPNTMTLSCTTGVSGCSISPEGIVTITGVGTFVIDRSNAVVVIFTPVSTFVGTSPQVSYTVQDVLGRPISSTYTPTVIAIQPDLSRKPVTESQSKNVLENDIFAGTTLIPETLKLRNPFTQEVLSSPTFTVPDEGTLTYSPNTNEITFTPNIDALVAKLKADLIVHGDVYGTSNSGAILKEVLDENGDVIGLEAQMTPITYQMLDDLGNMVSATYTPKVFFPKPVAQPDVSRGPANESQRQFVLGNDAATGARLLPETLELVDNSELIDLVSSTVANVMGEGQFQFAGDSITFTPDMDALVETLRLDFVANGSAYQNSRLRAVYENDVYMGLEADVTPIKYRLKDEFGRWVETIYTPTVFFPKPAASPDVTRGAINQPQSKAIIMNDDPSTGVVFDNTYLKIWDYETRGWVTSPVVTRDGTYTVEAADGIVLAAGLGGNKQILASALNAAGAYNLIVFTPVNNFVGTAIPIPYQIRDIFGQYVESTYTPTIETDVVASLARLVRTGVGEFGGVLQAIAALLLVGAGMMTLRKRRREEAL